MTYKNVFSKPHVSNYVEKWKKRMFYTFYYSMFKNGDLMGFNEEIFCVG